MRYLIILLLFSNLLFAEHTDENQQLNAQNTTDGLLECYVFYEITAIGFARLEEDNSDEIKQMNDTADILLLFAKQLQKLSHISDEALTSKMGLMTANISGMMDNSYANYSVIADKYHLKCKTLAESYVALLQSLQK
jgi:hypothetical protein